MEQRLSFVTLGVADLDRSRRFYERMGWRASSAGVEGVVVFFQAGPLVLALFGRAALAHDAGLPSEGSGFGGIALAHNVRRREDVDAVLAEARGAGGEVLQPGRDTDWGGYAGYFADPDGHPWEVAWNPKIPMMPDGGLQLPA